MVRRRPEFGFQLQPQLRAVSIFKSVEIGAGRHIPDQETRGGTPGALASPHAQRRDSPIADAQGERIPGLVLDGRAGRLRQSHRQHRHALEQSRSALRLDSLNRDVIEPNPARMTAEEAVYGQGAHRFFRQNDHLPSLPVVCPGAELGCLTPKRRAVGIDQIDIQRVVSVRTAIHILRLAPTPHPERPGVGAIQIQCLAGSKPTGPTWVFTPQRMRPVSPLAFRQFVAFGRRRPVPRLAGGDVFETAVGQQGCAG